MKKKKRDLLLYCSDTRPQNEDVIFKPLGSRLQLEAADRTRRTLMLLICRTVLLLKNIQHIW